MRKHILGYFSPVLTMFVLASTIICLGQVSVTTYHNDNARTAQNLNETFLKPSNVTVNLFGKIFSQPLDGNVYTQPLYVPNVTIPGKGTHNVVYVATEHDSVYAYDADNPLGSNASPLWKTSFLTPGNPNITTVPATELGCPDLVPELGITGTPVIDPSTNTMYLVARTQESGVDVDRLHALDITTGLDTLGSPILIHPTVPGTGEGGTTITFNSVTQNQRAALALQDGKLYVGFGSLCDTDPYHGWLLAYKAQTLGLIATWISTPNELEGGIWGGAAAPALDSSSNLFFATSNGTFDINLGGSDIPDSVIKLPEPVSSDWSTLDYFAPYDQPKMAKNNLDLGSGGVMLLPDQPMGSLHQHLLVSCGKEGTIYLLDRDSMGHFNAVNNSQIVQVLVGANLGIMGSPAWWNNNLYYSGRNDVVKQYSFNTSTGQLSTAPVSTSTASHLYILGTSPSISANGNTNAIVWTAENRNGTAIMHAYDATNLNVELYNTTLKSARDGAGFGIRFMEPTIANGKVYLATNNQLNVYSVLGVTYAPGTLNFGSVSVGQTSAPQTVTLTILSGTTAVFDTVSTNNTEFNITSNTCTGSIVGPATCKVSLTLTPAGGGTGSGTLTVVDGAGKQVVSLTETGAGIQFTPNPLSFGLVSVGTPSAALAVTVNVVGTQSATFETITLGGTNPGDFSISSDTCSGQTIPGNGSCQVRIVFKPMVGGNRYSTLKVPSNDGPSPALLNISGVGRALLTSIAVTPTNPTISSGTNEVFTATGTYNDGSNKNITVSVKWTSSTTSVATISNTSGSNGVATGVSGGSTTIKAALNGITGTTTLTVH